MKYGTVQELGLSNEVHLCKSCCHEYPDCEFVNIIFGTGGRGDNIAACGGYEPIQLRHPKHDGCGDI